MSRYGRTRRKCRARLYERQFAAQCSSTAPPSQLAGRQWEPVVSTTGDQRGVSQTVRRSHESKLIRFLTFDAEIPTPSCPAFATARENARTVREIILSETVLQLNKST